MCLRMQADRNSPKDVVDTRLLLGGVLLLTGRVKDAKAEGMKAVDFCQVCL
jgi:hypothetical protein